MSQANNTKHILRACVIISILFISVAHAAKQNNEIGIAAIVGDSVISNIDLQERIKIAMFASNLPKDKGLEQKILPQVLRNLVDEKLYRQEAENLGIAINNDDIARVVADIEQRNNIQPGKFNEYLASNGISQHSMMEQIKSQLTWSKVIARKIRPQITVTDNEIDEKLEHMTRQQSAEELNLSKIGIKRAFVAVAENTKPEEVKKLEEKILQKQAKLKNCKDFTKFAKDINSNVDPQMVTTQISDLAPEISTQVANLKIGELSRPTLADGGYNIYMLCEKTDAASAIALKNKIRETIFMKKLEIQANRYLRDLRRGVFIEIRI